MFSFIIGASLKFRFLVVAVAAAGILYGVECIQRMPIDVFPEFAPARIQIQTEGPGMSAAEVEELVTVPLEQALRGIPGLDALRSQNVTGLSSILLVFKRGVDLLDARQLVQERLQVIAPRLPVNNVAPVMLAPMSAVSRVMHIAVSSNTMSMDDLSVATFWNIQFRLKKVPGVANAIIWGYRNKQLLVLVEPERLRANGVTLEELMETTGSALNAGLLKYTTAAKGRVDGIIETDKKRFVIHQDIPIQTAEQLGAVVIRKLADGRNLRIADVARVEFTHDQPIGEAVVKDGPGLLLVIQKFPWANTLEVTRGLEKAIDELKTGLPGIDIEINFRPASFVESSFANLTHAMLIGGLFVIAVLIAFLFEWRVALISLAAIPLSLMAAAIVLYWQGYTVNIMVLAGFFVGLGSIVDDAIIDVENILRRLRINRALPSSEQRSAAQIVLEASLEVRRPIVYATLIIVLSVVPVFFLHGVSGAFFSPLVYAYCLALLASMVVALTITPALALILLRDAPLDAKDPPLTAWLKRGYLALLSRIVRVPNTTFMLTGVVTMLGILAWPLLGHSLMPDFKERDLLMHWVTKPGTSREAMFRNSTAACREFLTIPGIRHCGSHIGRAIAGPEIVGMNFGENWIRIDPSVNYEQTVAKVQDIAASYPGIHAPVMTFIRERIKEVVSGAGETLVVRLFGPDLGVLAERSKAIETALSSVDGLQGLKAGFQVENPQLQITVDVAKARQYGLKPGDVRRKVATYVTGTEVTDVFRDGRIFGVVIWSTPETRSTVNHIEDLLLDTPSGMHVRLSQVAEVKIAPTPNAIQRDEFSRRIDITANVAGDRDLNAIMANVYKQLATVTLPHEYRIQVLGDYAERKRATERLRWITIVAALGILLLLQVSFGSWRLAGLTFLTLPAAVVGSVLAVYASSGIVSLGSMVGMLAVLGVAARNGILLVHHYQHLEVVEGVPFGPELVLRGAAERLAPILMTSLCTGLALVPLIWSGQIPGHEIEHPMAVVIIGGLITSTVLSLLVVPLVYSLLGSGAAKAATSSLEPAPASA